MARLSAQSPLLHEGVEIIQVTFGRFNEIGRGSRISHSAFGDYAYCDRYADIANATIGKFANIASFVRIGASDHPLDTASCHHFLYRSDDYWDEAARDEAFFAKRHARRAVIGHDTWLGHGAMIKPGVMLGHGAVVAAGAVVTQDVAPYMIVAGIPAAPLRPRQPQSIAERLIALAWWDWDHARIGTALQDFRSLSAIEFLAKYEG